MGKVPCFLFALHLQPAIIFEQPGPVGQLILEMDA